MRKTEVQEPWSNSRDAPHLFGLGPQEMLADEITQDLIRDIAKDGAKDVIEAPPASTDNDDPDGDGVKNEIPVSIVDHMEFYLLNYFKPGAGEQNQRTRFGRELMEQIGCTSCHIPDLRIERDRRVADVETIFDPVRGIFNRLFATAVPLFASSPDSSGYPAVKSPLGSRFNVTNIFTDFKRHDLGPNFYERNYDGTITKEFMTEALWGVADTAPYGHDGRSINLKEVILRHGGEAERARDNFDRLPDVSQDDILAFLKTLIVFPPDDTASTLDPGDRTALNFPQFGHGSIKLTVLFNDPTDPE